MEELTGNFIGYRSFVSKKNGNTYYVLSFVFITVDGTKEQADYFVKDIFVTVDIFDDFISKNKILSAVKLKREIVGDTVRYYI